MNNCVFTGYIYDDPEIKRDDYNDSNAEYCEFTLIAY